MTGVDEREVQHDIETPASIQIRFGIEFLAASLADATVVMSMPMSGLRNPFTGAPTVGSGGTALTAFSSAVRVRGSPQVASITVSIRSAGRVASRSYFGSGSDGFPYRADSAPSGASK